MGPAAAEFAKADPLVTINDLNRGSVTMNSLSEMIGRLKGMEGNTMQQKVEGYLLSIGVTAEEISAIRTIFLG